VNELYFRLALGDSALPEISLFCDNNPNHHDDLLNYLRFLESGAAGTILSIGIVRVMNRIASSLSLVTSAINQHNRRSNEIAGRVFFSNITISTQHV
jgi:hypothetical protein